MKPTAAFTVVLVFATGLILGLALDRFWGPRADRDGRIVGQGPTVEQLQDLSELITTRLQISDVLKGQTPGRTAEIVYLVRGDCDYAIDLSRIRIADRDETLRRATIRAPRPHIVRPRVDHERSSTYLLRDRSWRPWIDDRDRLRDEVLQKAQTLVEQKAAEREFLGHAEQYARHAIHAFYKVLGWDVTVEFN